MPVIPSGLACVAAATSAAGHSVELVDLRPAPEPHRTVREALEAFRPDVIGVSVRNIDDQNMANPRFLLGPVKEVITVCRDLSSAPIVLGGAGYSIFPQSALAHLHANMGIQGEGEAVFPLLLSRLEQAADLAGIPALDLPGQPAQLGRARRHLDLFPLPDVHWWQAEAAQKELWLPLQTRRGCPLDCSYCSTPAIEGRTLRKRAALKVAEAVARYAGAGFRRFYFADNTFNLPPSYAMSLCRELASRRLGISWRCIIYPLLPDAELVSVMAQAGCTEVSLGFESGSARMLHNIHKRFSPSDVRRTCAWFADHGIRRTGFLLLGGPGETMESVEESLAFADSLALEVLKVTVGVRIYPGTPLAKTAIHEGMILPEEDLLFPRFYLAPGLDRRLFQTVADWKATRPHWIS